MRLPAPFSKLPTGDATIDRLQDRISESSRSVVQTISGMLQPSSLSLSYAANWKDFGGGNAPGTCRKDASGRVWLSGLTLFALSTAGAGLTIGTLPAGYRPAAFEVFAVANWNGSAYVAGIVLIRPEGVIETQAFANGGAGTSGLCLSGISFVAAQ